MTDTPTRVAITRITPHWRPTPRVSPEREAFIRGKVAGLVGLLRHAVTTSTLPCTPLLDLHNFSYKVYNTKLKIFHGPLENRQVVTIREGQDDGQYDHLVGISSQVLEWLKELYAEEMPDVPSDPSTPVPAISGAPFPTPLAPPPGLSPEGDSPRSAAALDPPASPNPPRPLPRLRSSPPPVSPTRVLFLESPPAPLGDSEAPLSPEEMAELERVMDEANREPTVNQRRYLASTLPRRDPTPPARPPSLPPPPSRAPPTPLQAPSARPRSQTPSFWQRAFSYLPTRLLPPLSWPVRRPVAAPLPSDDASSWTPTHPRLPLIREMTPLGRDTSILRTAVDVSQPRRREIAPTREPLLLSPLPETFDESLGLLLEHPRQLAEETSVSYHESDRDISDYDSKKEDRIQLGIALARNQRDLFRDRAGSTRSVTPISEASDEYFADDEGSITPTRPRPTGSRAALTESSSDLGDADSIAEDLDDALRDLATLRGRALGSELIQRELTEALRGERRGHEELREASARAIVALEETVRRLQADLRDRATSGTVGPPSSGSDSSSSSSDERDPLGLGTSSPSASAANHEAAEMLLRVREAGRVPPPPVDPPIDTETVRADPLAAIAEIRPEIDVLRQGWRDLQEASLAALVRGEAKARELLATTENTEFLALQARMQGFHRESAALQAQLANVRRLEAALALKTAETTRGAEENQALARQVAELEAEKKALTAREIALRDQVAQSGRDLDRIRDLALSVQESLRRDREDALAHLATLQAQHAALVRSIGTIVPAMEARERDLFLEAEREARELVETLRAQFDARTREQSDFLRDIAARNAALERRALEQRDLADRVLELQRGQEEASRKEEEQQALINELLGKTTTRIEALERELHTARETVTKLEARLRESSEAAGELAAGAERRTRKLHAQRDDARARVTDLERALAGVRAAAEEDHARLTAEQERLRRENEDQRAALERALADTRQQAAAEMQRLGDEHQRTKARIDVLEALLREARAETARVSGVGVGLANELIAARTILTDERDHAGARTANLERRLASLREEATRGHTELEGALETARQEAAAATLDLGDARARISTLERAATTSLVDTEARSRREIEELYEQFLATAAITKDTLRFSEREFARRGLVEGHLAEITARLDRLSNPQQPLIAREILARRDIERAYSDGLRTEELEALRARLAQSHREKHALSTQVEGARAQDRMLGAELARRQAARDSQEALLRATSPTVTEEAAARRAIVSQESAGRELLTAQRRLLAVTEKDGRSAIEASEARARGLLTPPRATLAAAITRQVATSALARRPVMFDREAAAALAIEMVDRAVSPILPMTRDALTEYDPPIPSEIEWPALDTPRAAPIFPVDDGSDDYPSTQATTPRRIADFEPDAESLPDTLYDAPAPPSSPPTGSPRTGRAIDAGLAAAVAPLQLPRDGSARGAFLLRHALLVGDASMEDVFANGRRGIKFTFKEEFQTLVGIPKTYTYVAGAPDLSDRKPPKPEYAARTDPSLVRYCLFTEADTITNLALQPTAATKAEDALQRFVGRIKEFKTALGKALATPEERAALVVKAMTESDFTQYFQRLITTRHQLSRAIKTARAKPIDPWASGKSNPVDTLTKQLTELEHEIAFYAALRRRDPTPPRAAAAAAGGGGGA